VWVREPFGRDDMKTRDEYVARLKADLDRWNAEAARWEKRANEDGKRLLEELRSRRDLVLYQLRLAQSASLEAWKDLGAGAEKALAQMAESMAKARTHFEKAERGSKR
jgi:hypothetical protein